jgi:hypothetical protein
VLGRWVPAQDSEIATKKQGSFPSFELISATIEYVLMWNLSGIARAGPHGLVSAHHLAALFRTCKSDPADRPVADSLHAVPQHLELYEAPYASVLVF